MMPSRDFLIRQAVLNAIRDYWPANVMFMGVSHALRDISRGDFISSPFRSVINREFRKLVNRNWEPLT